MTEKVIEMINDKVIDATNDKVIEIKKFNISKMKSFSNILILGKRNCGKTTISKEILSIFLSNNEKSKNGYILLNNNEHNQYTDIINGNILYDQICNINHPSTYVFTDEFNGKDIETMLRKNNENGSFYIFEDGSYNIFKEKTFGRIINTTKYNAMIIDQKQHFNFIPKQFLKDFEYIFIFKQNHSDYKNFYDKFSLNQIYSFEDFSVIMDNLNSENYECLVLVSNNTLKNRTEGTEGPEGTERTEGTEGTERTEGTEGTERTEGLFWYKSKYIV